VLNTLTPTIILTSTTTTNLTSTPTIAPTNTLAFTITLTSTTTIISTTTITLTPTFTSTATRQVGLGFGLMSGAFSLVNVLADSLGPGTLGQGASPAFFLVSSLATLAMVLLHTAWGVVFFHSLDTGTYWQTAYVVLTHLTVSLLSLLNSAEPGGAYYAAHLVPTYLLLLATGLLAARVAGASLQGVKRALACSPSLAVPAEQ